MKVMAIECGFHAVRDVLDDCIYSPMADKPEVICPGLSVLGMASWLAGSDLRAWRRSAIDHGSKIRKSKAETQKPKIVQRLWAIAEDFRSS